MTLKPGFMKIHPLLLGQAVILLFQLGLSEFLECYSDGGVLGPKCVQWKIRK